MQLAIIQPLLEKPDHKEIEDIIKNFKNINIQYLY